MDDKLLLSFGLADNLHRCVLWAFHGRVHGPFWPEKDTHSPLELFSGFTSPYLIACIPALTVLQERPKSTLSRLSNFLWRSLEFFKRLRQSRRYGYKFLFYTILFRVLSFFHASSKNSFRSIAICPTIDFSSTSAYKTLYAAHPVCCLSVQPPYASLRVCRSLSSYKQRNYHSEYGCTAINLPTLYPSSSLFREASGVFIGGVWQESIHDDKTLHSLISSPSDSCDPAKLEGLFASLLGPWSNNYYHWIIQYIPRLHLIDQFCGLDSIDGFLIPSPASKFHVESLAYFGIDSSRIIEVDSPVRPDRCIISSIPSEDRFVPSWVIDYFRQNTTSSCKSSLHKIFVSRGAVGRRQIVNVSEVNSLLNCYEYLFVDPGNLSFADQIELFARSSVVCGVHGAALANIVFCPKGSSLIELIPSNYRYPCFQRLSISASIHYFPNFGTEPFVPIVNIMDPDADIIVDIKRLASVLDRAKL